MSATALRKNCAGVFREWCVNGTRSIFAGHKLASCTASGHTCPDPKEATVKKNLICPSCGGTISVYANPLPTVDILIHEPDRGVVIIARRNPPLGFALPGGFVDEGEWLEHAALREAMEETSLSVQLTGILGVYSRPDRDPRSHTLTTVFTARARNPQDLQASDDALAASWYNPATPPEPMCFDHGQMLEDFVAVLEGRRALGALSTEWLRTQEGREYGAPAGTGVSS